MISIAFWNPSLYVYEKNVFFHLIVVVLNIFNTPENLLTSIIKIAHEVQPKTFRLIKVSNNN